MPRQHGGGLTFVFTDIEGSTQLVRELASSYGLALRIHRRIMQSCAEAHGGSEMGSEGDALFFVFNDAFDAIAAAVEAQTKIDHYAWPEGLALRVRMGVHTGPVTISGGEYVGLTVHEVARICGAAHGGQILCSSAVLTALHSYPDGVVFRDLGAFILRGIPEPTPLIKLCADSLEEHFPPPREAVREGGMRVSVCRRGLPPEGSTEMRPEELPVSVTAVDGSPLTGAITVEVGRASNGPRDAFRLVVLRNGVVEEEYDGLTTSGQTAAASIVNVHSRLIRVADSDC